MAPTGPGRGLRVALAACRAGDMLVVTKLDRLARSVADAHGIATDLTGRGVKLQLGGSAHDPADSVGKFEADLARMRTREGMVRITGVPRRPPPRLLAPHER